jgi:hypothetical protein
MAALCTQARGLPQMFQDVVKRLARLPSAAHQARVTRMSQA